MNDMTHLDELEAEAIYIMREVVAECEKPVMLYSIGKDSSVMLHLALKAFYPEKPPFPFLHVNTTWKFKEMIEFRDNTAKKYGLDMIEYINEEGVKKGINPFDHGSSYTDIMKTQALKQALDKYGFTAAFGGGRRDEEILVFPILNWTKKDIWQYIKRENIDIVPLYFASVRPFVRRDGNIIMVDDDRLKLTSGEKIERKIKTMVAKYDYKSIKILPVSAIEGDNITTKSNRTFRGFQGQIESGKIKINDEILALPSNEKAKIKEFLDTGKPVTENCQGYAMTSACGIVTRAFKRSDNLTWHTMDITREFRSEQKNQSPKTIWLTGLSGSGKSTLANELEKRLVSFGKHTMLLDGDNVRMGLNKNLGFKESDRIENIRRIAEVAKLMNDAGLIVITSFISPYVRDRRNARKIIGEKDFIEIYVSTPVEECEKRDVKGLYKKARSGEISDFTGISSLYEVPECPEIIIDTTGKTLENSVNYIMEQLEKYNL